MSLPPMTLYRRVSELNRASNFRSRIILICVRWILYLLLIPSILSGVIVGASLELGSSWSEAFKTVSLVADATLETYQTQVHLFQLSTEILFSLEREDSIDDLDFIVYVAEVRSKTSELSANVDRTLADYLKKQVKKNKTRNRTLNVKDSHSSALPVTLDSLISSSLLGALIPIICYWLLSYLLTRWWLDKRARETVALYMEQQTFDRSIN